MEYLAPRLDGKVLAEYWSLYPMKVFNYNLKVSSPNPWEARDLWNWQEVETADTVWSVNISTEEIWVMNGDTLFATPAPIIFVGKSAARKYYRPKKTP
jgi:hypothetical protein